MRIEEQNKGRYNKYPDKIEADLIRILNRYFNDVSRKDLNLVDAIIDEVLQRLKEEIGLNPNKTTTLPGINTPVNNFDIPELLLIKENSLKVNDSTEYISDKSQKISYIEISDNEKKYRHVGGYGEYSLDNSNLTVEMYHDIHENRDVLKLRNTGNNPVYFKIIIYS